MVLHRKPDAGHEQWGEASSGLGVRCCKIEKEDSDSVADPDVLLMVVSSSGSAGGIATGYTPVARDVTAWSRRSRQKTAREGHTERWKIVSRARAEAPGMKDASGTKREHRR